MTQPKARKRSTQRASNPDAIRATVYLPPASHAALVRRWKIEQQAARKAANGERHVVKRVTLSDVIVRACAKYLGLQADAIAK
jgi:hypothetical protein